MSLKLDTGKTQLDEAELETLAAMRRRCARRILLSTTLAGSGHPGGSLSSLDLLLVTYGMIKHDPKQPRMEERDRLIASIGHISPGIYSALSEYGYFTEDDFLSGFRRTGSGFPGHVEKIVPGVEWDTGNLGQGLSTAVGLAAAFKTQGRDNRVIVIMGDGEQQKGQVVEAVRFAHKYKLDNLTVVIDRNHLQICGSTEDIMPQDLNGIYAALGWQVEEIDGHDCNAVFQAMSKATRNDSGVPMVIMARTTMGKGISFMEDLAKYHGAPLKKEQLDAALEELGVENDFEHWQARRNEPVGTSTIMGREQNYPEVQPGTPTVYAADTMTDQRSAYGTALLGLAKSNNKDDSLKIAGISCDLEGSVKMGGFHAHSPAAYFEAGIQEHHAAGMCGGMGSVGMAAFFSTFGVFAASEVYNQIRINDFNHCNMKIVATHLGLDVGEDGPTHQCIDYLGLFRNLFNFSVFMPADPNQCDRIVRYIATQAGNHFVGMGRSKTPVICKEDGVIFFDADYEFTPGRADWLRRGDAATIITYGAVAPYAVEAWKLLKDAGIDVGVLNMASLLPLDKESLHEAAAIGPVITAEDHHIETGLGAAAALVFAESGQAVQMKRLGVGRYGASGKPADLYKSQGLDPASLAAAVREILE